MLKVVLVDDEISSLNELGYLLGKFDSMEIAGSFTNPIEALGI